MKRQDLFRYWSLISFCFVSSIVGIYVGCFVTFRSADGGRGGAVAVAAALYALFISRGYGRRLIEARLTRIPEAIQKLERLGRLPHGAVGLPKGIENQEEARQLSLDSLAAEQKLQNKFLAWTTAGGTLVWGFGDLLVKGILHCRGIMEKQ